MADGSLIFDTRIDQSGFKAGASEISSLAKKVVGTVVGTLSAGAIAKGLISIGKESIAVASDLQEVQNVVDVTFGEGAGQIDAWAKASASAYGLTELAAKQYTGTVGAMLKSMGLAEEEVANMSISITSLAGDMASFYNLSSDDAFAKIRAGLSGETEPLKQLGINLSVANLEAYALAQGMEKSYTEMSQAEQTTLRYNYILEQTADAQGDFARTADSYANSMRTLDMNVTRVKNAIGNALLPEVTNATNELGTFAGDLAEAMDTAGIRGGIEYITSQMPVATAAVTGLATAYAGLAIIQTVQSMTKKYAATQATLNMWLEAGTAAEVLDAGVLSTKELLVGLVTGKLKLATVAQAAYNAMLAANPLTIFIAALAAAVGAFTLYERALVKNNETFRENEQSAARLRNEISELSNTLESSASSYEETSASIENSYHSADRLVDKLFEMSAAYTGTNVEQELMSELVNKLNTSVEGLTVSFDEQTGEINMTADAIRDYMRSAEAAAKQQAALKRMTELWEQQAEAEYLASRAADEFNAMMHDASGYTLTAQRDVRRAYVESQRALEDINAEVTDYEAYMEQMDYIVPPVTDAIEENADALQDAAEAEEVFMLNGMDMTAVLEEWGMSVDDASKHLETYTKAAQNMFDVISTESEVSVADMISNLQKNTLAVEQYGANLATLAGRIPDDLYQSLAGDPAKFAGVVAELASASPEDLAELSASWTEAGTAAQSALFSGLTGEMAEEPANPLENVVEAVENDTSLEDASRSAIQRAEEAMQLQTNISHFDTIGKNIIQGLIDGLYNKSNALYTAARHIVEQTLLTMKDTADEESPSKITHKYGEFLIVGWANGIKDSLGIAKKEAHNAVAATVDEFSDADYPSLYSNVREGNSGPSSTAGGVTYNTTQNIYAEKQTPAEMLREAKFLQERAVLMGV